MDIVYWLNNIVVYSGSALFHYSSIEIVSFGLHAGA